MYEEFRVYIKQWLKDRKLTQKNLAEMTKINIHSIRMFMGNHYNSDDTARAIADALDVGILYYKGTCKIVEKEDIKK